MDFERARFNMIEQQIRPWNVLDPGVLALLRQVPREQFVTLPQRSLAFADLSIPLDHDQVMMQPKVEARLIQALALTRQDRVLEIGTGSGYVTALLAASAASVVSVEIYSALSLQAGARLQNAGFATVDLQIGDAANGWPGGPLYNAIIITGSLPILPTPFLEALAPGGRLVAIIGEAPAMEALLYQKTRADPLITSLFDTVVPPLVNAPKKDVFIF
jgi:protein-L-isoaspartate(D-aspartate) O-methyltransferase